MIARRMWVAYSICQILTATIFLLYLAGSLILVGGRVARSQSEIWPQVLSWPIFVVPGWLVVVPAIIGALLVIPMCVMTPAAHRPRLLSALAQTFAAGAGALLLTAVFTFAEGRPVGGWSLGDVSGHWIALPFLVFSVVVLVVALVAKYREYARLWKSGELHEAQQ